MVGVFKKFDGRTLGDIPEEEDAVECGVGASAGCEGFVVGGEIGGIDPMSREFDLGDLLLGLDAPNAGAIEVWAHNVCPIVTKACVVHDGGDGKGEFLGGGAGVGHIQSWRKPG